jgi:hypothetical protein
VDGGAIDFDVLEAQTTGILKADPAAVDAYFGPV